MSPCLILPIHSLCFKQKKNMIPIFAFIEKSCGVVVHSKNEYPTVPMLMLIVGKKQKHTRPVHLLSHNKYNLLFPNIFSVMKTTE